MSNPTVNVDDDKPRATPLGVSGLVILSAIGEGLDRAHRAVYRRMTDRLYSKGETKESLLQRVEALPLPPQLKGVVSKQVENNAEERTAIEIEVTVEEV